MLSLAILLFYFLFLRPKYSKLWLRLIMSEIGPISYQLVVATVAAIIALAGPFFLYQITGYIRNPEGRPPIVAFTYAGLLGLLTLTRALLDAQTWHTGRCLDIRLRSILINEIYSKSLRRVASTSSSGSSSSDDNGNTEGKKDDKKDDDENDIATVGKIVTLMSSDTEKIREGFQFIFFIVVSPIQIIASISGLLYIVGLPALAGLGVMLLTIPATAYQSNWSNKVFEKLMAATDKRTNTVNEVLQGIRIIKFFAWEKKFLGKINEARQTELRALIEYYIQGAFGSAIWFFSPLLVSLFTFFALTQIAGRELNAQLAFTCIALFNTLRMPLAALPEMIVELFQCRVSINRIQRFLDQEEMEKYVNGQLMDEDLKRDAAAGRASSSLSNPSASGGIAEPTIGFRESWFQYYTDEGIKADAEARKKADVNKGTAKKGGSVASDEETPLLSHRDSSDSLLTIDDDSTDAPKIANGTNAFTLRGVELTFPIGGLTSVCGATGSGKSSILQALLGEMKRLSGSVHLPDPRYPKSFSTGSKIYDAEENLHSGIAYVAQTSWLQNATIRDNITFGELYDPIRYDRVIKACSLVKDLETFEAGDLTEIGEKGINLSGGQKQRVSLARAVYSRAAFVLMDDPLSAVDAPTARHLFDNAICGLLAGRTRILVTHATSVALPMTDYLVVLQSGEVVGAGNVEDVLALPGIEKAMSKEDTQLMSTMGSSMTSLGSTTASSIGGASLKGKKSVSSLGKDDESSTDAVLTRVGSQVSVKEALDAQSEGGKLKNYANGKTREDAKKLVETEESAKGAVKLAIYVSYIYSAGGWLFLSCFFLFNMMDRSCMIFNDYWVKLWADAYKRAGDNSSSSTFMTTLSHQGYLNGTTTFDFSTLAISKGLGWNNQGSFGYHATLLGSLPSMLPTSFAWFINSGMQLVPTSFSSAAHSFASSNTLNSTVPSNPPTEKVDLAYYISIYALISCMWIVFFLCTYTVRSFGAYAASQRFHRQLMDRIIHAPMRFFDTTPIGRILNRASKDLGSIDTRVMGGFDTFFGCMFDCLATLIVVVTITPVFVLAIFPMAVVYRYISQRYLNCSRELKRLDSVTRSPIYSMFSETLV
jgi:ABC-type multidrug transport system fused ATPase/permease subunit